MMKRIFYRQGGWVPLLMLVLLFLSVTPVSAANQTQQQRRTTTSNLPASVYLAMDSLQPLFQDQISQQVSSLSGSMLNNMLGSLPAADLVWARALAGALIRPSATLKQLTPQSNGLDAKLSLSLFPGDPRPIDAGMLVTFSVRDASTIQVSAQSDPGSPQLVNGPLTTLAIPFGQLESISTTAGCGNFGLKIDIQVPVTLAPTSNQSQNNQVVQSTLSGNRTMADLQQRHVAYATVKRASSTLNAYAEITNSSINALGSAMGALSIGSVKIPPFGPTVALTAENIQINTQGTGLEIMASIYTQQLGHIKVANAVAFAQPSAANGQLMMTITSLKVNPVIGPIQLPALPTSVTDSYQTQLRNMLNSDLGNALAGQFTVNSVSVGGGPSCAASDSLILQGTTNLD
jgi:hypothetical protein